MADYETNARVDGRKLAGERRRKENRKKAEELIYGGASGAIKGQRLAPVEVRRDPTLGERISQALNRGYPLNKLAKEIEASKSLDLGREHLKALIERLDAEINARVTLKRALEAHL